jgi:universal stress protein A
VQLRKILVPIDFSELSLGALAGADALAAERGGELTLLHVHPVVQVVLMDFAYTEPAEQVRGVLDEAEKHLRQLAGSLRTPLVRVRIDVRTGDPKDTIIEASAGHDLVVMSTHGRKGMGHFLLGSVAERVVRGAACSVLIWRG